MHEGEGEADCDAGEAGSRHALGDQQDHKHEGAGEEHLEQERTAHVDRTVVVGVGAEATRVVGDAEGGDEELEDSAGKDRAKELHDPVGDSLAGGHAPTQQHGEGDGRVHMGA